MFPVVLLFGVAFNMNEIKKGLGRDGETERVRESVQSGGREIRWVNDGLSGVLIILRIPETSLCKNHLAP